MRSYWQSQMLHGIFTYIHSKNDPVMSVNIPAPFCASVHGMGLNLYLYVCFEIGSFLAIPFCGWLHDCGSIWWTETECPILSILLVQQNPTLWIFGDPEVFDPSSWKLNSNIWLVGQGHPSEKWWSSSIKGWLDTQWKKYEGQLGWLDTQWKKYESQLGWLDTQY